MIFTEHIEKFLGKIVGGDSTTHPVFGTLSFPFFKNQPFDGVNTHLSLGLSKHVLQITNVKKGRIELLISLYDNYSNSEVTDFLLDISDEILKTHQAPLRGEIIYIKSEFLDRYDVKGFYIAHPVFFEEEFWVYENSTPDTIFIWLIPLFFEEINYIKLNGWNKFEDLLESANCDFWSLERNIIVQ